MNARRDDGPCCKLSIICLSIYIHIMYASFVSNDQLGGLICVKVHINVTADFRGYGIRMADYLNQTSTLETA